MHFGFSYIGLAWLVMLSIPNLIWTKCKPLGYDRYAAHENRVLVAFERVGHIGIHLAHAKEARESARNS